ncbi:hypothetical protein [Nonomuraea sp. PA05]|nr:hypothetical protein [Nonomuraea sp. PA05]
MIRGGGLFLIGVGRGLLLAWIFRMRRLPFVNALAGLRNRAPLLTFT